MAETPKADFIYAWYKGRCLDINCSIYTGEIEYTLLNKYGETMKAVTKLTDNSGATMTTYDESPAVAVSPDGHIGIMWYHYIWNSSNSQFNYNIYFAILDASGSLVFGPTNLTNNAVWGISNALNVPRFYNPQITATGNNRFALAWQKMYYGSPTVDCTSYCSVNDIYYAVRDAGGGIVKGITQFTFDTPGNYEGYGEPNLTTLTGNRALLTWSSDGDNDIYYAVLGSDGSVFKSATNLTNDYDYSYDWNPDAVQLSDGKIVVAWTGDYYINYPRFAVLDSSYNLIEGPTALYNPAAVTGNAYVSVAADAAGHSILTWMDYDSNSHRNLYYALVDGNGSVLTEPMIFRTGMGSSPYIETSYTGYGNTSYLSPAQVDLNISSSSVVGADPAGLAAIPIQFQNSGAATGSVTITAALDGNLTYDSDTSGVTPVLSGTTTLTWTLPGLDFLASGAFSLVVSVPVADYGTSYPVALEISSAGTDANPADNVFNLDVMIAHLLYLPLIQR